jgi:bacillolysin
MAHGRAVTTVTIGCLLSGLIGSALLIGGSASAGRAPRLSAIATAEKELRARTDGQVTIRRDRTGKVHFVGTQDGHPVRRPDGLARDLSPGSAARAHIAKYGALFGIEDAAAELAVLHTSSAGPLKVVHLVQRASGVPVLGGELAVTLDSADNLVSINGETGAPPTTVTPSVPARAAARTATAAITKSSARPATSLRATAPSLWIYDPRLIGAPGPMSPRLVWRLQVETTTGATQPQRWTVLVDARSGTVALAFEDLEYVKVRRVCDNANKPTTDWACPSATAALKRSEGDPPVVPADDEVNVAYDTTGAVYDFYANLGRDSLDDQGLILKSTVRVCVSGLACPFGNAFWDGEQMAFGAEFARADDVIGHELTHGVTQYTSGLLYYYQSGAINESISDVMGELFDQQYPAGSDGPTYDWRLGEDLPIGTIRSMSNPPSFGQPDRMTSSLWTTNADDQAFDAGGVHTNSGVGNKAAYLMAAGGAFNGQTVTGIGGAKVAQIWYATDQLLTSGADYADLYAVMQQACANLAAAATGGISATDCVQVKAALDAVEMSQPANEPAIAQASKCPSGYVNLDKFSDDFNRTASGSLGSKWVETGSASINGDFQPSPTAGNALFIPEPANDTVAANRYAYTSAWTALSSTYTTYLHFDHAYSLDWLPGPNTYFDGARVEIDLDGDTKGWFVPSATAWSNGPARTLISDHPLLPSAKVFAGESRGWTSSKLSLSSYKGKKVKIRFRMATDGLPAYSAAYGWWLDNVRLYQCSIPPTAPTSVVGNGYAGSGKISWGAASSNGGTSLSKYVVYLYKSGTSSYINRVELPTTARSYTFTKDSTGNALSFYGITYTLTVRAKNIQGAYGPAVSKTLIGTQLTGTASATTIPPGGSVTISGKLTRVDTGAPLANTTVQLRYGAPGSSTSTYLIGPSVKTAADGTYSFGISPTSSTDYRVYYSTGSTTYMGTRTSATIKVTVT